MAEKLFFFFNDPQHFVVLLLLFFKISPQSKRNFFDAIVNSHNLRQHYSYWIYNTSATVAGEIDESTLTPSLPEGRPLLSRLRESRGGRLCLDLGIMAGGKTWPRLWALRRPMRRRPSIKRLRVQPRSRSYIHPGSWWMTISHGFLIISKEAKGKQWVSSNTGMFSLFW